MAQKTKPRKKPKAGWLRTVLFFVFFPLIVWFVTFLIWFYWQPIIALFSGSDTKVKSANSFERKTRNSEKAESAPVDRPREKLSDEDRQKLDDILKRR